MGAAREQTVAPTEQPIEIAELKAHLRLDSSHDDDDLLRIFEAVLSNVESYLGWQLCQATYRLTFDRFRRRQILRLTPSPLIAVTSIEYYDEANLLQTWDSANYEVDAASQPCRVRPVYGGSWPTTYPRFGAGIVTYTAGHATVDAIPDWARLALRIETATRYENRLDGGNVNANLPGFQAAESLRLLSPHRLSWDFGAGLDPFECDDE